MMKQISKQILTMLAFVLPLLGSVGGGMAQSVVTLIVTDPLTGIALNGLDPVSYFSEGAPVAGHAEHELRWSHVPWYFANQANRDVFERSPEIYAPQFGGHDAMAVARGFVADSDPRIHTVFKQRLYLFYSAANREAFLLAPDAAARTAAENWPDLSKDLSAN
jgi:YHS domain-containing protein